VAVLARVAREPRVQGGELGRWPLARLHDRRPVGGARAVADREDRAEHDADAVGARQLAHAAEVALDRLDGRRPAVARDVVRARDDQHDGGPKRDHVLVEAEQHLIGGLAADPAIDVRLAGKESTALGSRPVVDDRVPKKTTRRSPGAGAGSATLSAW
jgi:hypothetical protein